MKKQNVYGKTVRPVSSKICKRMWHVHVTLWFHRQPFADINILGSILLIYSINRKKCFNRGSGDKFHLYTLDIFLNQL